LDDNNPAADFYPSFKAWIGACKLNIVRNGKLSSILGREFEISDDRDNKSVFNATIQGSVAHAMQNCLKRVWELYPQNLFLESHDSITLTSTSDKFDIRRKVSDVSRIMVQPFEGILKENPQFPIKVSIGSAYKKWKEYKRYKSHEEI
jgi:hypothetical protein